MKVVVFLSGKKENKKKSPQLKEEKYTASLFVRKEKNKKNRVEIPFSSLHFDLTPILVHIFFFLSFLVSKLKNTFRFGLYCHLTIKNILRHLTI